MINVLGSIYLKNFFWNFLNQFGRSGVQILVTIVLARILLPSDFGMIAMVTIITQFADIIIDSGFLLGIVQVKDITQKELSAVFVLNLVIGFGCSILIFLFAPLIASLYQVPELIDVARILSISCVFTASAVVQHGLMIREMNYRKRTISQLISQLVSGIIAIYLANKGYGIMSLVYYSVIQSVLSATLYWVQSTWRPSLGFKLQDIKRIWAFSSNVLGVTLLGNIAGRTDLFLTGRFFPPKILGLYSKGKDFAMLPATIGSEIVSLSLFPIMARLEADEFNLAFRRTLEILIFCSSILFGLLTVNSKEIVIFLLGDAWIGSVIIFRLYFIVAFLYLINAFLTNVINASGKSSVNLKKELIQAPIRILSLVLIYYIFRPVDTVPFIYFWIVYYLVSNAYSQFLISEINNIRFWSIFRIGFKYVVYVLVTGTFVYHLIEFNCDVLNITIRSLVFILIFSLGLIITKDNIFKTVSDYVKIKQ